MHHQIFGWQQRRRWSFLATFRYSCFYLGISELMSTNYSNAIECFRHSNLCDPFNKEVWIWLAQAYCKINNFVMVTQCLNCYLNSEAENRIDKIKVKDIKQTIESAAPRDFY